jgi:hypothetical protein
MSALTQLRQRLENINAMAWSQETPAAYQEFTDECRASALLLASEGNFNEAFSIASLSESLWTQHETPSTWTSFYTHIAKAILNQQQQSDAMAAVSSDPHRMRSLQKIVKVLSHSDALEFSTFLTNATHLSIDLIHDRKLE